VFGNMFVPSNIQSLFHQRPNYC